MISEIAKMLHTDRSHRLRAGVASSGRVVFCPAQGVLKPYGPAPPRLDQRGPGSHVAQPRTIAQPNDAGRGGAGTAECWATSSLVEVQTAVTGGASAHRIVLRRVVTLSLGRLRLLFSSLSGGGG